MKKHNKNLMKVVAVLLSLVLLTSAVVSSTFAKYVVTKDASVEATLTKYNLTVNLAVNGPAQSANPTKKGDSISYTYNAVKLKPGDNYSNLIEASIKSADNKKAVVQSYITITVDVSNIRATETNATNPFKVPKANFTTLNITEDKAYLPLKVYVGGASVQDAYKSYAYDVATIESELEKVIGEGILAKLDGKTGLSAQKYERVATASDASKNMAKVTATIGTTEAIPELSGLGCGFEWPKNVGGSMDEVGTWVAKTKPTFDLKYTITVSQ